MFRGVLLKNVDKPLTSWNVNAFARGIIIQVVGVLDARKRGNHVTRVGIKHR